MHDRLLAHQDELTRPTSCRYASELGLDVERFWEDAARARHAPRVAEDVASADESGVGGHADFFINGRRHQGAYDIDDAHRGGARGARRAETCRKSSSAGRRRAEMLDVRAEDVDRDRR